MRRTLWIVIAGGMALALLGGTFVSGLAASAWLQPAARPVAFPTAAGGQPVGAGQSRSSAAGAWAPGPCCGSNGAGWGMGQDHWDDWGWQSGSRWGGWDDSGWGSGSQWGWVGRHMGMMPWSGWNEPATTQSMTPTTNAVSFAADVMPVFTARCIVCHGGVQGLWLDNYDGVLAGGANGPVVVPGDPGGSRLVQYVASGYMPYGGPSLSPAEVQLLVDWVAAGTPNN